MSLDRESTEHSSRELDDLYITLRHIGRAMASFDRVPQRQAPRFGLAPDWLIALDDARDALRLASNRLVDAVEAMPGGGS